MLDDIRPQPSKRGEDQNKNDQNQPNPTTLEVVAAPPEVQGPLPLVNETPRLSTEQNGFVVLPEQGRRNPFRAFMNLSKKQRIVYCSVAALLILALGGGAFALYGRGDTPKPVAAPAAAPQKAVEPPKPTTEASRLTGVQIPIETNKRPVTSIQIENSPDSRPQSGLRDAGVVFEAIAEGGITRFNASFLEAQPDYIGPIRSVRPYYAVLAAPFDPIFVHAGGSADGLAAIRNLGLKDMDHGANGAAFRRVTDRYAPHNLYSSTADLDKAAAGRSYTNSDVKSLVRKPEKPNLPVTAKNINLTISSPLYNVAYAYDPASNTYLRSMAGKPHTDLRSGAQLTPKVVVAMVVPYSQNGIYSVYQVVGSGAVSIFQDGQIQQGTWTKASEKEQIKFTDAAGQPIGLNPGQTWITLVKTPDNIAFTAQ